MRSLSTTGARILVALVLWAAVALGLMRLAGGAAMFCIDPPAADPGWKWKVPLAWATVYGVSTFVAIVVSTVRPRSRRVPAIVALVVFGAVVLVRAQQHNIGCPYWVQKEMHWGVPAMVIAGVLACVITAMTKKTEHC